MSGYLCRQVLIFLPLPVPMFMLLFLALEGSWPAAGWTILVGGLAAVASLLLGLTVRPSPLPRGLRPEVSARRAMLRYRQITHLRLALPLAALLVGAGASLLSGGLYPFLAAVVIAWPQMLLAWPSFHSVSAARRGMEVWGGRAYLWAGLDSPAPAVQPEPVRASGKAERLPKRPEPNEVETGQAKYQVAIGSVGQSVFDELLAPRELTEPSPIEDFLVPEDTGRTDAANRHPRPAGSSAPKPQRRPSRARRPRPRPKVRP